MSTPARLVVVGPGRVGQSLAAGLAKGGRPVELRGRVADAPPFAAGRDGVSYAAGLPGASPPGEGSSPRGASATPAPRLLDTLVFAVPDDALAAAAAAWATALDAAPDGAPPPARGAGSPVALHTSGVHGPEVLDPLRDVGFSAASWHPLTSLAAPDPDGFRGVTFGVSGDAPAVERARSLAAGLGGRAVELEPGSHARYHAAAVFASNFLAACLAAARDELGSATGGRAGLDDLAPLVRSAVENVLGRGLPEGVTGPVERGDAGTVRRHLEVLAPGRRRLYRDLARELLDVVGDRLPDGQARELRGLLEPGDP